jgi:proteic killer suppression protein
VIASYGNKATQDFYDGVSSKHAREIPSQVAKVARRTLDRLAGAGMLSDLKGPGLHLERLDDRPGFWGIRINLQYRIEFRFEAGNAHEVEISKHYDE